MKIEILHIHQNIALNCVQDLNTPTLVLIKMFPHVRLIHQIMSNTAMTHSELYNMTHT